MLQGLVDMRSMFARIVIFSVLMMGWVAAYAQHPYADKTNAELTDIATNWESMDSEERRALLTEIKGRMAA